MSIEQKQEYLRRQIVDGGLDPNDFYQFWQSFNLQIEDVEIGTLCGIVQQFKEQSSKKNIESQDDQFGEYQEASFEPQTNVNEINWDFLAQPQKIASSNEESKPEKKQQKPPKKILKSQTEIQRKSSNPPSQKINLKKVEPKSEQKTDKYTKLIETSTAKQKQSVDLSMMNASTSKNIGESSPSKKDFNVTLKEVYDDSKVVKKNCLKLQENILEHHTNVQIYITKYEEIQEGQNIINKLWKGTDFLFTIKTIGRNKKRTIGVSWEVKRKHSDFQWLRNMLIKFYPGVIVPPIPSFARSTSKMSGYQRKMQGFLLDCYHCPELRNSKYFEVFLSYTSGLDFQNFKKSSQNNSKPKNLSHILNMKGQLELLYGDKIETYAGGLQNFLATSSQHLKRVKSIILQINEAYENISLKYKELSDVFLTMSSQSCQFSEQQCYPRLTQTYKQIANLTDQHSQFCQNEKEFIDAYMLSHFAYEKDRIDNMHTLIQKHKTFTNEYNKPKHQTQKSNESMFYKLSGLFGEKTETVELPSTQTQTLKEQVGFYNSQLMKQSIRCIQRMISSHVNHFSQYGHMRIDNVDAMQKIWSQVMVELSKLHSR